MQPISSLPMSAQVVEASHSPLKLANLPDAFLQSHLEGFLSLRDITFLLAVSLTQRAKEYKNVALYSLFTRGGGFALENNNFYTLFFRVINGLSLTDIAAFQQSFSGRMIVSPEVVSIVLSLAEEQRVLLLLETMTLRLDATSISLTENMQASILSKNAVTMALQGRADIRERLLTSYSMLLNVIEKKILTTRSQQIRAIEQSDPLMETALQGDDCLGGNFGCFVLCAYSALTLTFLALSAVELQKNFSLGIFSFLFLVFAGLSSIPVFAAVLVSQSVEDESSNCLSSLLTALLAIIFAYPIMLCYAVYSVYVRCQILSIAHIGNTVPSELLPQITQWINNINALGGRTSQAEYQRAENLGLPAEILGAIQMQPAYPTCWNRVQNIFGAAIGRFSHFQPVSAEPAELEYALNNV